MIRLERIENASRAGNFSNLKTARALGLDYVRRRPDPPDGLATPIIFWTSHVAGSHEQIFGVNEQVPGRWSERLRSVRPYP